MRSLKINFIWSFAGNAFSALSMWLLLVLITKLDSPRTVGVFGMGQAIALPVNMFFGLKLLFVQVTDAGDKYTLGQYLSVKLISMVGSMIVTTLIGLILYDRETALVTILLGFGYSVVSLKEIYIAIMQKNERMDYASISKIIEGITTLISFGLIFYLFKNLIYSITSMAFIRIAIMLIYDIPVAKKVLEIDGIGNIIKPSCDSKNIFKLVFETLPLGFVALLGSLFTSMPRLFLDGYRGKNHVGYFVAMSSLLVASSMIVNAMSQTVSPRLAVYYQKNKKQFRILLTKLLILGLLIGTSSVVAGVLVGEYFLTLVFSKEYSSYNNVLVLLLVAGSMQILFTFMIVGLTAARIFTIQLPLFMLCVSVVVIVSFILVPRYGMHGAAISLISCYSIGFFGSTMALISKWSDPVKVDT